VDVLGENDPALDLSPEKRFLAVVQGKRLKFSEALRRGLAEILALSAGLALEGLVADDHNFIGRARRIVCRLLPAGSDWKRWASIGDLLPLLAEAAPEEFLNAVARDLKSPNPALVELMRQEYGDAITGAIYHTGVLWAFEALAWPTKYTATVGDLLAKSAALVALGTPSLDAKGGTHRCFVSASTTTQSRHRFSDLGPNRWPQSKSYV
jgi:hypothetical protein